MTKNKYQHYLEGYRMMTKLESKLNKMAEAHGVSFSQYLLLKQIIEEHCDEPTRLADVFGVSRPAMSRKLNNLYRNEMIIKKRNSTEADQRKVILEVTLAGEVAVKALDKRYHEWFEQDIQADAAYVALFDQFVQRTTQLVITSA